MIELFGLKSCDTCRAARKALEGAGHEVRVTDVRDAPLNEATLTEFLDAFGEDLVNRRSTTWKGLSEAERQKPPLALLAAHPALMKRPVLRGGDTLTLGWGKDVQKTHLG